MDGTLIDTEPYWMASEAAIVEEFGGTWSEEHGTALVGFDLIDAARYIAEHGPVPLEPEEIVERLLDGVISQLEAGTPWRPGARRLLAELNDAQIPCALVTMSWRRFVDPVIAQLPPGTFAAIVCGDEIEAGKPDPLPYLRAAELLGVPAGECIAIEDSPTGVASAVGAGCRVLGVPNVRGIDAQPGVHLVSSLTNVDLDLLTSLPDRSTPDPAVIERRRRGLVLGGLAVLAAFGIGTAIIIDRATDPGPLPEIPLDAWAPYWTLSATTAELPRRLPAMREVSPFWFRVVGVTEIVIDPNTPRQAADEFISQTRRSGALLVPSIIDALPAGEMAAILANPVQRRLHVDALVAFARSGDFDGLDIDYEQFAFADGRSTWAMTRPNWVAFIGELADALRADGRTLTVSIPPIYDDGRTDSSGYWVYDHGAIADMVDKVRIMAYDYSTARAGPIAPLDFVQRSVDGVSSVVDDRSKLVLGIPVYGYNWPVSTLGTCPDDVTGRVGVTARSIHELLERRGGTPLRDTSTGEWSFSYELDLSEGENTCTQLRQVHYVDGDGALERIDIARRAKWGGVALWALGYEDDQVWEQISTAIVHDQAEVTQR